MAFVLEQITPEDQQKILHDAQQTNQDKFFRLLNYVNEMMPMLFPKRWAIDHKHDCYLFSAPVTSREERSGHIYYLCFQGGFYSIETKSIFENIVKLIDYPEPEILMSMQQNIQGAFSVYGHFGEVGSGAELNNVQFVKSFGE